MAISPRELPVTVVVGSVITCFFLAGLLTSMTKEYVAMIPANTILSHTYFWNVFTSGFFEDNPIKFALFTGMLIPSLSDLERKRQNPQIVSGALVIVTLGSGVTVFLVRVVLFYLMGESFLFTGNYGLAGLVVTTTVGRLFCNENESGPFNTQLRQLVLPGLLAYALLAVTTGFINDLAYTLLAFPYAISVFSKLTPLASTGHAATIDSATFVPERLQPLVRSLLLVLTTICSKCLPAGDPNASAKPADNIPDLELAVNNMPDPVAERRRARALKALDEKLAQISKQPEISLDGDDD